MPPNIRAPRADELETLRDIEWAAGTLFADIGMPEIAADEPAGVEVLAEYVHDGRAWVATDENDTPIGYAIVDVVDDLAHLEQLSVRPEHGRTGVGKALLDEVERWAEQQRREAVTLTTFEAVPWNAPYYAKHGFRTMRDEEIGPELTALRAHEAGQGLDPDARVCMRKDV